MAKKVSRVAFCSHCFSNSRQVVEHEVNYEIEILNGAPLSAMYCMAVCQTCQKPLVYHITEAEWETEKWFERAELVWPEEGNLHRSVPQSVQKCYKEAFRILPHAPNAFATQIRRALEYVCSDKKAEGKTLASNLQWLAEKGMIPDMLAEMSTVLRLLGNAAAHATDQDVSANEAWAIDAFFRSLMEYLYVAPANMQEYRNRLANKQIPISRGYTFR
jgi:hypothetical protein